MKWAEAVYNQQDILGIITKLKLSNFLVSNDVK